MLKEILGSQEVMNAAISLVALMLTGIISFLSTKINTFIHHIDDEKLQKLITSSYDHVSQVVEDAVAHVKQVLVDDLKADGKLDAQSIELAKKEAIAFVLRNASPLAIDMISVGVDSIEKFISDLVESKVNKLKG